MKFSSSVRSCVAQGKSIFDVLPLLVTLILEVGTYKWHATHRLLMIYVFMKFHKIIFNRLEVVVQTSE